MTQFIQSPKDLVTPREATRQGFLRQALEKTERAQSFIERAFQLRDYLNSIDHVPDLSSLEDLNLKNALIAASGFSDKAKSNLTEQELADSLSSVLEAIIRQAGVHWRDEVVFRFLLTRGDTLGGAMRNVTGAVGAQLLTNALHSALSKRGFSFQLRRGKSSKTTSIPRKQRGCYPPGCNRTLEVRPKLFGKSGCVSCLR